MKKYLIIKLVYGEEINSDVHDLMLDEYEKVCNDIGDYADTLGAELLINDSTNVYGEGRSYATVEHNFPMTQAEKETLVHILSDFFVDGELDGEEIVTHNTLSAVRFLQTEGELFVL